jgi:hypothetical protein
MKKLITSNCEWADLPKNNGDKKTTASIILTMVKARNE